MPLDLAKLDQLWAATKPAQAGTAEKLPDGTYTMVVETVERSETKNHRPCVCWTLKVVGPRHSGRKHWHRDYLDHKTDEEQQRAFSYLMRNLGLFGVVLASLADLPRHAAEIQGRTIEVTLKTTNQYQACYFNKVVNAPISNGTTGQNGPATPTATAQGISSLSPF